MEIGLFGAAFACYSVAMSLYIGYALTRQERLSSLGRVLMIFGAFVHAASLVIRTYYARQLPQHGWYVPWSNWFESFSFFSLIIVIEYLLIQWKLKLPILGAFVSPLVWIMMVVAIRS